MNPVRNLVIENDSPHYAVPLGYVKYSFHAPHFVRGEVGADGFPILMSYAILNTPMMKMRMRLVYVIFVLATLITGSGGLFSPYSAQAAAPQTIGYTGFITNSSGVAQTGTNTVRIRIYNAASGGTLLYDETHAGVVLSNGSFSLAIGSGTVNGGTVASLADLPFDQQYFLTLEVTTLRL